MKKRLFISNLLLLSVFFVINTAQGQQKSSKRDNYLQDFVFKGNNIQFNFSTLLTSKSHLEKLSGSHQIGSSSTLGLLLSFKYQANFNNKYSLIIGPEVTILGRNLITSFNKNEFTPPLIDNYELNGRASYIPCLILSMPISLEKRWIYSKKKYLFGNSGLRLNFSTGGDFDIFSINLQSTNNSFYNVGGVDVYANNDAKPWISIPLNAGHAWLLRNNNLLQLSICSNMSFTKYVNGTYQIDVPGKPLTTGRYSSTGSYIGLSMNYVFTNANYRIRKSYEKKL